MPRKGGPMTRRKNGSDPSIDFWMAAGEFSAPMGVELGSLSSEVQSYIRGVAEFCSSLERLHRAFFLRAKHVTTARAIREDPARFGLPDSDRDFVECRAEELSRGLCILIAREAVRIDRQKASLRRQKAIGIGARPLNITEVPSG